MNIPTKVRIFSKNVNFQFDRISWQLRTRARCFVTVLLSKVKLSASVATVRVVLGSNYGRFLTPLAPFLSFLLYQRSAGWTLRARQTKREWNYTRVNCALGMQGATRLHEKKNVTSLDTFANGSIMSISSCLHSFPRDFRHNWHTDWFVGSFCTSGSLQRLNTIFLFLRNVYLINFYI